MLTSASVHAGIAFSALEEGHWVVYYQESPGEVPGRVDPTPDEDQTSVRLSPDGTQVAFETPQNEVKVFRRRNDPSGWEHMKTVASAVRPAWHAGVTNWLFVRYAVTAAGEDSDLWVTTQTNPRADLVLRQTGNQDYPAVSPDGRWVVYITAQVVSMKLGAIRVFQQVWLGDLQSASVRQVLMDAGAHIEPAWSPSGNAIALATDRTGQFEIWTMRPDGTGLRQITSGPGAKTRPAWSPDGRQMLVTVLRDGRHELGLVEVESGRISPYKPFRDRSDAEVRDADWR